MKPKPAGKAKPKQSGKKYQPPKPVEPEDKEFMLAVAGRLRELQKQEGILTAELCKNVGISRYTYLLITTGQVYWNSEKVLKLIKHYGIDAASFFKSL
jgi:DNA-binding XRE family transcriptional regulator